MDNAVALVQAFLRLHGYLTVTELSVVRAARGGGQECPTDLDVLAFRFGEASGPGEAMHHPAESEANALLGITGGVLDMIIGEVKEGRAELNDAATRHDVLTASLERFGCCRHSEIDGIVHELLRHGRAGTQHRHGVRLVAFGTLASGHQDRRCHVVLLSDIVAHLRSDMRRHWDAWRASASKDPGFGMLLTREKAERGHLPAARSVLSHADQSIGRTRDSRGGQHHG